MGATFLLSVVVSILSFGAKADTTVVNTQAINAAIASCAERGGGVVVVPPGEFVTGTVRMRSHVMLRLERGAVLRGSHRLADYEPLRYDGDLSKYESGRGTVNYNAADDPVWSLSLISFVGVSRSGIEGEGTIDGAHVFNPQGEEGQRGPHTILIADGDRLRFTGFSVKRSANYAIMGYRVSRSVFRHLRFFEGWDGIHLRGSRDTRIADCEFHTGDDAIAGGYWQKMRISRCKVNSSCNGIRMIMPSEDVLVEDSHFYGPGLYPHRTSGNRSSLAAINIEPGAWGDAPGRLDNIRIRRCETDAVLTPLSVTVGKDNELGNIEVSRLTARNTTRMAASVKSWGTSRTAKVTFKDCDFHFLGIDDPHLPEWFRNRPTSEWPVFPSWALYFRNVDSLRVRRVRCSYAGREYRTALRCDGVGVSERRDGVESIGGMRLVEQPGSGLAPFVEFK